MRLNLGIPQKWNCCFGSLTEIFQRYEKHELDKIHLVYSRFVNTMRQEPRLEVLLPIGENVIEDENNYSSFSWEYRYEPSPIAVWNIWFAAI